MRPLFLLPALAVLVACASPHPSIPVYGPDAVFKDLDEAAVDALAYAHLRAWSSGQGHRMHGGVLRAVDGGYSYGEITAASPETPNKLVLVLRADDVAHFRTYPPTSSPRTDRNNERFSRADRANVDELDPRHRPAYVLTPSLAVRVYRGEGQRMRRIARLPGPDPRMLTARTR